MSYRSDERVFDLHEALELWILVEAGLFAWVANRIAWQSPRTGVDKVLRIVVAEGLVFRYLS